MAIVAKDSGDGFDREIPSAGLQDAVCTKIFDLGKQLNNFNGNLQHKVLFAWELAETIKEGKFAGQRFVVTKEYTLSLHEKATLRKDIEGWRAKKIPDDTARQGIDLEKFVKMQCTLAIQHETGKNGSEYAKVASIAPVAKNAPMMHPELPDDWCPGWIKKKIDDGVGADGEVKPAEEEVPAF